MCGSNCNNSKKIREGDIKDHTKLLLSYKLFQWGNHVKNFLLSLQNETISF